MKIVNSIFDLLLGPLGRLGPWAGMVVLSLLAAVIVLLIFKATSRPDRIRRKKDLALAALLELALFRDHPRLSMAAFGRVLTANFRYLGEMIVPLTVTLVPLCIIMVQTYACLAHRPLHAGETTLLKVRFPRGDNLAEQTVSISDSPTVAVETPVVRARALAEFAWRIRAANEGRGEIVLNVNGSQVAKSVETGARQRRVSSARLRRGFWNALKEPSEPPLPATCGAEAVEVVYPAGSYAVLGLDMGWFWTFLCATLIFAFALKGPLGVEI